MSAHAMTTATFMSSGFMIVTVATRGRWRCPGMHTYRRLRPVVSGPHGGDAGQRSIGRAGHKWSVIRVVGTRDGFRRPRPTPLLRNQEFTLHPLEALRLRIAFVFNATGEHRGCFRRWSDQECAKSFAPPKAAQTPGKPPRSSSKQSGCRSRTPRETPQSPRPGRASSCCFRRTWNQCRQRGHRSAVLYCTVRGLALAWASNPLPSGDLWRSVVKDDAQQRVVDLEHAVVFNEPELAKLIHEEVHA